MLTMAKIAPPPPPPAPVHEHKKATHHPSASTASLKPEVKPDLRRGDVVDPFK